MRSSLVVGLLWAVFPCFAAGNAPGTIEAETGPPWVELHPGGFLRVLSRGDYEKDAALEPSFVARDRDPWAAEATVRYALFGEHGKRTTFAIRPRDGRAAQFLLDTDGDGDLRDERPRKGTKSDPGWMARFRVGEPEMPLALGYAEIEGQPPLATVNRTVFRAGKIRLGKRRIRFVVQGLGRKFDEPHFDRFFDTDGDRRIDAGYASDERYNGETDDYVNLAGVSYRFAVNEDGSRLTLTPLPRTLPDRPRLAPGNPAPDFEFVDLEGKPGKLSDLEDRVVLLYVWGSWCVPCRGETPHLVAAYERFRDAGFEILGVAKSDLEPNVREYLATHGIGWRQILEDEDGTIVSLYRADAVPSTFLIKRGRIVDREIRGERLMERLELLFSTGNPADRH